MAHEFYFTIKGNKQGAFKGESSKPAHKAKIQGLAFEYSVSSPRDSATGQASGKRQHKPVRIVKEWGAATPQIFTACVTNETLTEVNIEFFKTSADGKESVYQTIKLTNATVEKIEQFTSSALGDGGGSSSARHSAAADTHELEAVSFTFQKIEMENKDGKTSAADDWSDHA